ncbi:MAG: sugar ABC transporter permease [Spirochaetales bacterium]|nr:sugar ABC transporter permease [Spirochaetales bacterium]
MKMQKKYIGLLFILPFFIFYITFNLYPVFYTFFLSLTKWDGFADPEFIGFHHYARIFTELGTRFAGADKLDVPGEFWLAFINTWRIWLPNIIMQLVIALFLGVIFTNTRLKMRGVSFFRAIFYFPNLVTAASVGILALVLLDWQHGAINQIIHGPAANFPGGSYPPELNILVNPMRAQMVVSIIQTWQWFGVSMILLMAGMQGIPKTYYEAADLDGASATQTFFKITLPLLMPVFTFVIVTSLIGGMQIFDIPFVFTTGTMVGVGGETGKALTTMVLYMYRQAFGLTNPNFGYAAAISYMLFVLIGIFSIIYLKMITRVSRGEA